MNDHKRVPMERYAWGGTDNLVWQHFDAAPLKKGAATLRLSAGPQSFSPCPPTLTLMRKC